MATTRLSRRSGQETLPAHVPPADPVFRDLLRGEACGGVWRIVEVYSASQAPFELHASWSGGDGVGQEARMTVARATRFAVYASSLSVRVANLSNAENRVGCNTSEGYCVSANQYEVRGTGDGAALPVLIPPFATHFRVDVADESQLASTTLRVLDAQGLTRAEITGDAQPDLGLPLGGAGAIEVVAPTNIDFRGVFTLSI